MSNFRNKVFTGDERADYLLNLLHQSEMVMFSDDDSIVELKGILSDGDYQKYVMPHIILRGEQG